MKICPNCSGRLHDAASGCPECGARWTEDGSYVGVPIPTPALATTSGALGYAGTADDSVYAGFGVRAAARLIDLAAVYALAFASYILGVIALVVVYRATDRSTQPIADALGRRSAWVYLIALVAALAYHVVSDAVHGSTLGKMALGLTVLGDSEGFCTPRAALVRELAYFVDALFFGVIAYSEMKVSPQQQRYGDKWARTVVVRRRSLKPAQQRTKLRFALASAAACLSYAAIIFTALLIKL